MAASILAEPLEAVVPEQVVQGREVSTSAFTCRSQNCSR